LDTTGITDIELQNVSFSYKSNPEKQVLTQVDLKLTRGKVTCLVGKNGSGKSTLAMLLAALYQPSSGSIRLSDGTDYNMSLDRSQQKKLVQVVPQQPALFNTTIRNNVRYSNPEASDEHVRKALTLANCNEFIARLEDGLETQVGPTGSKLSGGQRQRIGLARALLDPPLLLVLDEPTSALDAEGEEAVSNAIQSCRNQQSSVLLITHRPKSLEWADDIAVLSEGRVVERGALQGLRSDPASELSKLLPEMTKTS